MLNKKNYSALFLIALIVCLSCTKEVSIVNPDITINPFQPAPLDTITATLIGELVIGGEVVEITSYDWEVLDQGNNEMEILITDGPVMRWSPETEGVFTLRASIIAGNKSVTETKQISVEHNTVSLQRYLAGDWHAIGTADFGGGQQWEAEFSIEPNGHYTAQVTELIQGDITRVFDNGDDTLDDPDKRIEINQIDGNGAALGVVRFVHQDGQLLEYGIRDLVFLNQYNTVTFTVFWGAEMQYEFERQ